MDGVVQDQGSREGRVSDAKRRRERRRRKMQLLRESGRIDEVKEQQRRVRKDEAMEAGRRRADQRYWEMSSETLRSHFEGRKGMTWRKKEFQCFDKACAPKAHARYSIQTDDEVSEDCPATPVYDGSEGEIPW